MGLLRFALTFCGFLLGWALGTNATPGKQSKLLTKVRMETDGCVGYRSGDLDMSAVRERRWWEQSGTGGCQVRALRLRTRQLYEPLVQRGERARGKFQQPGDQGVLCKVTTTHQSRQGACSNNLH
ncbi:hypothetical protein IWZ00DRAFT_496604 [Phyllosticta capitalensis]|uniref:uncharacterized protein n=1 Tax=Phyllosticta capitalensis TaxID=121624 RepID=UPI00312CEAE9